MIREWLRDIRDNRFFIPGLILITGSALSTALFMSAPEAVQTESGKAVILVDAFRVKTQPLNMIVSTQGEVVAKTRTKLVSEVSGIVTNISQSFIAGGYFKAEDLLITIDDRNYVAELERARANVAGARSQLAEEEGLARYAIGDWKKSRPNVEPSDLAAHKPQIAEAQANLDFALAELKRKQGDLDRTRVSALYTGLVEKRDVDIGQFVSPGTSLGVIFAIDEVEVRLPIPLHDVDFLDLPDPLKQLPFSVPVKFSSMGGGLATWHGEIVRTEAVMDRKNRVLYAIARVKDPYAAKSALRVGSYVSAQISGRYYDTIARIPRAAVRPGNQLWMVNSESKLERRMVNPIRADERFLYVRDEVKDGEIVSVTPLENPLPGTEVRFNLREMDVMTGLAHE